jgi:hypothetical protein
MAEHSSRESRALPIEWQFPPNLVSHYATNLVVQRTEQEFVISFFELRQPILLGSTEEKESALASVNSVPAVCVARIIVSSTRMPEFVRVLQDQLQLMQPRT